MDARLTLLIAAALSLQPAAAQPMRVPLECRLAGGPWQACSMTIEQVGSHWWLDVGQERLEFRSDGRGSVNLRASGGTSRAVMPAWNPDQALCWDGVCARGDIPLD
jgi:hypothetical protein